MASEAKRKQEERAQLEKERLEREQREEKQRSQREQERHRKMVQMREAERKAIAPKPQGKSVSVATS